MADITDEEVVEIANNFLLNSPPGEFMEVVTGIFSFENPNNYFFEFI
jgi:hypothetical protein